MLPPSATLGVALSDTAHSIGVATGDAWVTRLHFSRYHFDRLIRSVAGEPPAAFRRRILPDYLCSTDGRTVSSPRPPLPQPQS
mgnify:CR=1 FL=1